MMFSYQLVSMVIFIGNVWQSNESPSCFGTKHDDNSLSVKYIEKLLKIDTGYESHGTERSLSKLKKCPAEERAEVRDEIYQELVCSFVFDSCHFMNLIRYLLSGGGINVLKSLIKNNNHIHTNVIFFRDEVVGMLNVLYHFGLAKAMDPLWLMYMYTDRLARIDKNLTGSERTLLLNDHKYVYRALREFTNSQKCNRKNKYQNDQNGHSAYSRQLKKLNAVLITENPIHVQFITVFRKTIRDKISYINKLLDVDNRVLLFPLNKLSLKSIMGNIKIMENLLVHFAEIGYIWKNTYVRMQTNCFKQISDAVSVKELMGNIYNCLNIFDDIMHYIIMYTSWKYVMEINFFLPFSDEQEQTLEISEPWTVEKCENNINTSNQLMSDSLDEIISILSLDEDEEVKPFVWLFKMPPLHFLNVQENKQTKEQILLKLKNINSTYIKFQETTFQNINFDKTYFETSLTSLHRMDYYDDSGPVKSVFAKKPLKAAESFFIFGMYIKKWLRDIDFKLIRIFQNFLKNYKELLP